MKTKVIELSGLIEHLRLQAAQKRIEEHFFKMYIIIAIFAFCLLMAI